MSIRTKVIGCFLAILFLFVGVSYYSYLRSRHSNQRLALVNELFLPLSRHVVQLQGNVHNLAEDMRRFYFNADISSESSTFSRMVRDLYPYMIHKKFTVAERLLEKQETGELHKMVGELTSLLNSARSSFDQMAGSSDKTKFENNLSTLRSHLQALARRVDDECQKITLEAQGEGRDNLFSSLTLSTFVVLFGIVTVLLSNRALTPLPLLISSIKRISEGNFNQSLKVRTTDKDEVALLAREYNRMLEALRERDIKIQLQQKELLQSERLAAVGQLSAEVVHEIRNPLNAISLNIDWLENELGGSNPEIARTVASISREIERLNQITESYLVRARVPVHERQKTPVHDLLTEILDFSKEEDRSRNIVIETVLADEELYVRTDRSRLKQAFLNVLKNAKEAMPRGGKLRVTTEIAENLYRIQFSDTGHGMNETTRRQTFQPFFTTKNSGTGLGLMLTQSIAEEAQGSLQCESQLGQGTTFTFQFPA